MEKPPYSKIQKGTLLIATPDIQSGFFFRTVILVCEHNPSGSFGIAINKPLQIELPEEINLGEADNPDIQIRAGGPTQTNQMMLLHTSSAIPQQTLQICEGVFLGGDLQFLQENLANSDGPKIHLCFGYSGWGAGQLEREFLDGQWFLYPASKDLLFDIGMDTLWKSILQKMGGKYASLSMIPEDLSLN